MAYSPAIPNQRIITNASLTISFANTVFVRETGETTAGTIEAQIDGDSDLTIPAGGSFSFPAPDGETFKIIFTAPAGCTLQIMWY